MRIRDCIITKTAATPIYWHTFRKITHLLLRNHKTTPTRITRRPPPILTLLLVLPFFETKRPDTV